MKIWQLFAFQCLLCETFLGSSKYVFNTEGDENNYSYNANDCGEI